MQTLDLITSGNPSAPELPELKYAAKLASDDSFALSQWSFGCEYFEHKLGALSPAPGLAIDCGCGAGNWTIAAARLCGTAYGCDVRPDRIALARGMAAQLAVQNIRFEVSPAQNLPYCDRSCSLVIIYNVLPYVNGLEAMLGEVRRVMSVGGIALIACPDIGIVLAECRSAGSGFRLYRALRRVVTAVKARRIGQRSGYCKGFYIRPAAIDAILYELAGLEADERLTARFKSAGRPMFKPKLWGVPLFYERIFRAT